MWTIIIIILCVLATGILIDKFCWQLSKFKLISVFCCSQIKKKGRNHCWTSIFSFSYNVFNRPYSHGFWGCKVDSFIQKKKIQTHPISKNLQITSVTHYQPIPRGHLKSSRKRRKWRLNSAFLAIFIIFLYPEAFELDQSKFLCPCIERSWAYCFTVVFLSVRLSVCTNLTWKLIIFLLLLNLFTYKAHIWYEGTSHQYASTGTKVKVICKGQGQM